MSQPNVIDFAGRQREQGHEPPPPGDGTVLGVVPIPGADATLVIVGYTVAVERDRQAAQPVRRSSGDAARRSGAAERVLAGQAGRGEDLVVDRASRVVRVDGREIDLTFREFELLDYLCSAPGRVYNRRQLLAAVWDRYSEEGGRTVDVHVLRLRRKLGRHAGKIVTVRNVGYKYQPSRLG
ncbi:winged helix-turn-helix domain-containing protein [Microbispora sp. NPDC049125]|uniref:winged helix-turn-helix domain-containing protein n=1 Tax=Microbispora sp. NPDC049125 TaxID=3154929 RepID=UPI003466DE60